MTIGSPESFVFFAMFLGISIILWALLLRLLKIKSLALAFALGYITIAVYCYLKGWRPLAPGGFDSHASEAVTFSWPAALLAKYLKYKLYYIILVASVLQYCVAGWVVDMIGASILGKK
jgi:hypothetical protein